jgi:serine/threonine protein kinase
MVVSPSRKPDKQLPLPTNARTDSRTCKILENKFAGEMPENSVCDGVQHAHQKAILHRDLKPSNILVSEAEGKPFPRIIDFGVSKAISQTLTARTVYTRIGTLVGTVDGRADY